MRAEPNLEAHRRPEDANALPFAIKSGGDGPSDTHLICGFFSCDARPFNPLLNSLPRFMRFSPVPHRKNHTVCSTSSSDWPPPKPAIAGRQPERSQPTFGIDVRRSYSHAHGSACEQQHWLAGWIAGSVGRPRIDAAARAPCTRLDAGRARFGSRRLTLGAGRSLYPDRRLSTYSVPDPIAHADRRQPPRGSQRQDCCCRSRNRLRIRSRIQPGFQKVRWPIAEPMADRFDLARVYANKSSSFRWLVPIRQRAH